MEQGKEKVGETREEWEKPIKEKREEQREGKRERNRGLERDGKLTQEAEDEEEEQRQQRQQHQSKSPLNCSNYR